MLFLLLGTLGMGVWELMHLGKGGTFDVCVHTYKCMVYLDRNKTMGGSQKQVSQSTQPVPWEENAMVQSCLNCTSVASVTRMRTMLETTFDSPKIKRWRQGRGYRKEGQLKGGGPSPSFAGLKEEAKMSKSGTLRRRARNAWAELRAQVHT